MATRRWSHLGRRSTRLRHGRFVRSACTSSVQSQGQQLLPRIGLEIHAQLASPVKLMSPSRWLFGAPPNTLLHPCDMALPGALPTLSMECVRLAVTAALALNANVHLRSSFDRKHYFYCDMPSGYQITQQRNPICSGGWIEVDGRRIALDHAKLEQDSGKLVHDAEPSYSLVDLNRAGVPLFEMVTQPVITSATEAANTVRRLHRLLSHVGVCTGTLAEGSMRCDINVSLAPALPDHVRSQMQQSGDLLPPPEWMGTRCEVKNVNSMRHIADAVDYEVQRQTSLLQRGERVAQETRTWDPRRHQTVHMRSKEDEVDYRYMPEPDLPPLVLSEHFVTQIRDSLPELPDAKTARYQSQYGLSAYDADVLTQDPKASAYFEEIADGRNAVHVCSWLTSELFGLLKAHALDVDSCPVSAAQLASLVDAVDANEITGKIGKRVLRHMFDTGCALGHPSGASARDIAQQEGWLILDDKEGLQQLAQKLVREHPDEVARYRGGRKRLLGFFVGKVMAETGGNAPPKEVAQLFQSLLDEEPPVDHKKAKE